MSTDQETLVLLAESATLASRFGMGEEAMTITEALSTALPDDENVVLIQATANIESRRFEEAAALLRDKVLAKNPDNSTAKAFLGLALHLTGKAADRDKVLQEVIDAGDDEDAVIVARDLIHS
ncbi:MAG: YscG family type III secretion system chaperone [Minwuiales bacterium]|nr:YscG family type III secretion system chaperone [Minwuiales bacterium]